MSTAPLGAVLASAALCCLAPQSVSTTSPTSSGSYVIQCEVWNVTEPGLVAQIEAQEPTAAEAVLQSLRGADQGVQRLARVLSPIDLGSQASFESQNEHATVTMTQSGATTQTGFAGYSSTGTVVLLGCSPSAVTGAVKTSLSLDVSGFQGAGDELSPGIPPDRHSIQVRCEGTSASGELRMVQFQTSEPGTLVVFLRATAL